MAPFNDSIKFRLWNLNINDLMLINFHISLKTKRFLRSFECHSDKTVTLSECLLNINNVSNKMVHVLQKASWVWLQNCSSYYDNRLESRWFYFECPPMTSEHYQWILNCVMICRHLITLCSCHITEFMTVSLALVRLISRCRYNTSHMLTSPAILVRATPPHTPHPNVGDTSPMLISPPY